jgi:hypothetical protein
MPIVAVQVRFVATSLVTKDDVTNTWHFTTVSDPPSSTDLASIRDALQTFYGSFSTNFLSDWNTTVLMKMYNLADPKPRAPITTYSVALSGPFANTNLLMPREVSMAVSYKASTISGVPAGRRRGRIYLPTFYGTVFDSTGRFTSTICNTVRNAANTLRTTSDSATGWDWVVYSRTANTTAPVAGGWVDNAPDIQRRRGQASTLRVVYP